MGRWTCDMLAALRSRSGVGDAPLQVIGWSQCAKAGPLTKAEFASQRTMAWSKDIFVVPTRQGI